MSTFPMQGTLAYDNETGARVRAILASESEVCHVFAAASQDHGRHKAVYFTGARLFSYGSHYLVARLMPGGVALWNADKSTMTTNGHRHAARHALSHKTLLAVPSLTELSRALDNFESNRDYIARCKAEEMDSSDPESRLARYDAQLKRAQSEGRELLLHAARFEDISDESLAYMAQRFGFGRAWRAIKREAIKLNGQAKAAHAREELAKAKADSKLFADCTESAFKTYWPLDERDWNRRAAPGELGGLADGFGQYAQATFKTRLVKAHKAAKASGQAKRTRILWERLKAFRQYESQRGERERAEARAKLMREFEAARDAGTLASLAAWRFESMPELRAEIESARAGKEREDAAAAYQLWREIPTACKRPDSSRFAEGTLERRVLEQFEREDALAWESSFVAWRATRGAQLPSAKPSTELAHGLADRFPDIAARLGGDPWRELLFGTTKAEEESRLAIQAEAERVKALADAEAAEAWINGTAGLDHRRLSDSDGGALLRIEGESLVTSHGARVPLAEAVQAFRFVKLVKARGQAWQRNGQRVRVGAYQLDSIDTNGGFVAGCHKINWPEIERVAILAGVFDAEASDSAVAKPAHA